ncbi:MAG: peptidylprolyl isomerase [Pseudomonadota bacterium]
MLTIKTNHGNIKISLDRESAPVTCENFEKYVNDGFYNGTIFHRVIPSFMIQCGGFTEEMEQKETNATIKNEADNGLKNMTGTLAMARTPDPHSASSQFFINVNDNDFLNYTSASDSGWGYCVFGKVTEGMEVVMEISMVATGNSGMHQNVPIDPIVIQSIERDE